MTGKHITRDFSAHKRSVVRPYDEFVKLEIFSYDPHYTQYYLPERGTLKNGSNLQMTDWKSWRCYKSKDAKNDMVFNIKYNAKAEGEYRIDLVYEVSNYIHKDEDGNFSNKKNTGKSLVGHCTIHRGETRVYSKNVRFEGINNYIKRKTIFQNFIKGQHTIDLEVPMNCYFMGVIIRKVKRFVGDNYYGDALGSEEGNLTLMSAEVTISDMIKASELKCEVAYDDIMECHLSPSGFYVDYCDEVNFYVKGDDGKVHRVFGGYVSSILADNNLTKLTIHCADRLVDSQNKYVLDQIIMQGGTKRLSEDDYFLGMTRTYNTYPQVLQFLCYAHEVTLKSNITKNYTVDGEKFHKGVLLRYGKKKDINRVQTTHGISTTYDNFVQIRNASVGEKEQSWTLYDASKSRKVPPNITNIGYLHLTYGIGSPKREYKTKITETIEENETTTAGGQKFGRCGQSQDGNYVMAIAQPSAGRGDYNYQTLYKTVFENKCPHCGGKLVWDSARSDTDCVYCGGYHGSKREWGDISETEITCTSCCSDFCGVTGWEKDGGFSTRLTTVAEPVVSSKEEQNKLFDGKMIAVPKTGEEVVPVDLFDVITKEAFKYGYNLGTTSSYSEMKSAGSGDCWAFSDLIYTYMKKYKVSCKIMEYGTSQSSNHRTVQYLDANNKWQNFPYRELGWNTRYNNNLNDTDGVWNGRVVSKYEGGNISNVDISSKSNTKTQTTEITNTVGYDKDKPFQGFLRIYYSTEQSFKAKKYYTDIKVTLNSSNRSSINHGFNFYWINNTIKKATLRLQDNASFSDFVKMQFGMNEDTQIYLQSIHMICPPKPKGDKENYWYKVDKSTNDNSSCKMNIYQIAFNDNQLSEQEELNSCGKSINEVMKTVVDDAKYYVDMDYGLHRKDDKINFRVNNETKPVYVATEGDDNNILSWNNISYSPISSLHNLSLQVYKDTSGMYYYVDSRFPVSVLQYGEKCCIQTSTDVTSEHEAYFNCRMNPNFNPRETFTYTITVPNYPNVRLGELVEVIANNKKLNSIKDIQSIKIKFDKGKMPRVFTELGLGELAPDLQLKKNVREMRRNTKHKSTSFSKTAIPQTDVEIFGWDR